MLIENKYSPCETNNCSTHDSLEVMLENKESRTCEINTTYVEKTQYFLWTLDMHID